MLAVVHDAEASLPAEINVSSSSQQTATHISNTSCSNDISFSRRPPSQYRTTVMGVTCGREGGETEMTGGWSHFILRRKQIDCCSVSDRVRTDPSMRPKPLKRSTFDLKRLRTIQIWIVRNRFKSNVDLLKWPHRRRSAVQNKSSLKAIVSQPRYALILACHQRRVTYRSWVSRAG